jgi:hypothetical protein
MASCYSKFQTIVLFVNETHYMFIHPDERRCRSQLNEWNEFRRCVLSIDTSNLLSLVALDA